MNFNSQEYIDAAYKQAFTYSMLTNPLAEEITHHNFAESRAVMARNKQDRFYGRNNKYQFVKNGEGKMELVNAAEMV